MRFASLPVLVVVVAACGSAPPARVEPPPAVDPVVARDLAAPRRLASGRGYDCMIDRTGQLWCESGGVRSAIPRFEHTASLSARTSATCAVLEDGSLACFDPELRVWTDAARYAWADVEPVTRLATPCVILASGSLECLAPELFDELGLFAERRDRPRPRYPVDIGRVLDVAASQIQVCAVREDGGVVCLDRAHVAHTIEALPPVARVAVGAGCGDTVCGLTETGSMTCLPTAARIERREAVVMEGIADVSIHGCLGCVVSTGGQVACFQGHDATSLFAYPPALVPGLAGVVQVSVGPDHACALDDRDRMTCFELSAF